MLYKSNLKFWSEVTIALNPPTSRSARHLPFSDNATECENGTSCRPDTPSSSERICLHSTTLEVSAHTPFRTFQPLQGEPENVASPFEQRWQTKHAGGLPTRVQSRGRPVLLILKAQSEAKRQNTCIVPTTGITFSHGTTTHHLPNTGRGLSW